MDFWIVLTEETDDENITSSLEEIFQELEPITYRKSKLHPKKQTLIEIFGLPYLFFFKEPFLHTRINIPAYDEYVSRLKNELSENIYEGYRKIKLEKLNTYQAIAIDDIDYNGKEMTLWVVLFY